MAGASINPLNKLVGPDLRCHNFFFFNDTATTEIYTLSLHDALPISLIGKGEVYFQNKNQNSEDVLKSLQWEKLHLKSKEGLALLNGTQFMSAYGTWCVLHSNRLLK